MKIQDINKDLLELQNKIYQQNASLGWYSSYRSNAVFCNLFVSELSEAIEGLRKDLMDDHLPQYKMVSVEIADCAIRIMGYLGLVENQKYNYAYLHTTFEDIHHGIIHTTGHICKYHTTESLIHLKMALYNCIDMIMELGDDPFEIINAKVEYNKHRADHKLENRMKQGGKSF